MNTTIISAPSFDALEDLLYVEHELTPTSRFWRRELFDLGQTVFDYHSCEFIRVTDIGNHLFRLEDVTDIGKQLFSLEDKDGE